MSFVDQLIIGICSLMADFGVVLILFLMVFFTSGFHFLALGMLCCVLIFLFSAQVYRFSYYASFCVWVF